MESEHMSAMIDKVASECVAVRLRMLNRVVTNIYDDALRPLDGREASLRPRDSSKPEHLLAARHRRRVGLAPQRKVRRYSEHRSVLPLPDVVVVVALD